jgi:magnesium chelatase family protein
MIAKRMASILPPMTRGEALETTKIHSVVGQLDNRSLVVQRPFRAPHHTCSMIGLVGGGSHPRPGEISMAHNGILFLDELPEFPRNVLESLRQPLEDGRICVVRAGGVVTFPARFVLIGAMNPCPCGYRGTDVRTCTCSERLASNYRQRISGPLLDRFDLFVHVSRPPTKKLLDCQTGETSAQILNRIAAARRRQQKRFTKTRIRCNAEMNGRQIARYATLSAAARDVLERYAEHHQLSGRAVHRTIRIARTLADLSRRTMEIADEDLVLALQLQQGRWVL